MKTFTMEDIRRWAPCYDPGRHLPESWRGTVMDILSRDDIPLRSRLWCVLRTELISEHTMRLFTLWCYCQTLRRVGAPDPRSVEAAIVADRAADGVATHEELEWAYHAMRVISGVDTPEHAAACASESAALVTCRFLGTLAEIGAAQREQRDVLGKMIQAERQ